MVAPNKIILENTQTGNPASEWDISGAGDLSIQGFATTMSVNLGETVYFKVNTDATNYRLDIYRLGYYHGNGARKVETVTPFVTLPQSQPPPRSDASTGLIDCGNWTVSATWAVPQDATSGVYIAKLVREDTGGASHIIFIVRDDDGHSDLLFQTSDTTWQAYNTYSYGSSTDILRGNSLYEYHDESAERAFKVSYNRPFVNRGVGHWNANFVFCAEYPMIRWLEANGYDVSYFSGIDTDLRGSKILEHKVFLSVGHDEYWSARQRANVEVARNAGVHLAFFSGNEVFWKIRWEDSIDGLETTHRTMVCYKETHANRKIDPTPEWTGTWRDPRFSLPADSGLPENALTGTIFTVNTPVNEALTVPAAYSQMRLWRNTDITTLAPGGVAALPVGILGFEVDEDLDNGFRPAGLVHFSSTSIDVPQYLIDFGTNFTPGRATHHLTLYRHSSGALVFGAGTIQWSWGLDKQHDGGFSDLPPNALPDPDTRMQQATVNLFADMGVWPGTLQADLRSSISSSDTAPPSSVITSPLDGSIVQTGKPIIITGTAVDSDGVVSNVEVSVDGGTTWHPATGSTNWSYIWTPRVLGSATIKSRAVDDSANLEDPSRGVVVMVEQNSGPLGLWNDSITPRIESYPDSKAVELGVKFRSETSGYITAVRFYKGMGNVGPHIGRLWTSTGVKLAEATFTNETVRGWQTVTFATAVPIAANTIYIASYYAPAGYFALSEWYFLSEVVCPPLRAPASNSAQGNGVFEYGSAGFPTNTSHDANYWVDVVFTKMLG